MSFDNVVIIPHFNDSKRLQRCLHALTKGDTDNTEILVIDNASTQPLDAIRAAFPTVRFVVEPLAGAANARNRGVLESTAPNLFFLDADCIPSPDWLRVAKASVGRADIIGGAIDVFD